MISSSKSIYDNNSVFSRTVADDMHARLSDSSVAMDEVDTLIDFTFAQGEDFWGKARIWEVGHY